ncbi:MAG: hypothetical protein V4524_03090 [Patescibacteria group bacterium]
MKKTLISLFAFVLLVSPIATYATSPVTFNIGGNASYGNYASSGSQCTSNAMTLCTLINRVIGYLNQILFLLIGLSVVVFVYYIFNYFIKPDADKKEAGSYVMYSVIGFFVILSMWGLVNILQNTFGLGNTGYGPGSWTEISNIFPR